MTAQVTLIIFWLIIACAAVALMVVFAKKTKKIGRFALRAAFGCAALFALNFILKPFGIGGVGLNPLTVFMTGLLGIPGIGALYFIAAFI